MIMKRCDRCGLIFTFEKEVSNGLDIKQNSFNDDSTNDTIITSYDICKRCMKDFNKWFNIWKHKEIIANESPSD